MSPQPEVTINKNQQTSTTSMPAVVASAGYPNTLEVILGGAQVQGQPGLYSEFQ